MTLPWWCRDPSPPDGTNGDASKWQLHTPLAAEPRPSTSESLTSDPLIARIQTGDESAFLDLVRTYADSLTRYARVLLDDLTLADDVVQDVFVAMWERRTDLITVRYTLRQYLLGAVRHRALNVLRHERAHERHIVAAHGQQALSVASNDAPARLAEQELIARVEQVLRKAPPQCRTIFWLHWRAELTYAEIAAQLGISLRTVYNQMYRATKLVAATIEDTKSPG